MARFVVKPGYLAISQRASVLIQQIVSLMFVGIAVAEEFKLKRNASISHFRVNLSLRFKARQSAKSVFIPIEIGTNYHNKNFALRLALKERLKGTRKWPIGAEDTNIF